MERGREQEGDGHIEVDRESRIDFQWVGSSYQTKSTVFLYGVPVSMMNRPVSSLASLSVCSLPPNDCRLDPILSCYIWRIIFVLSPVIFPKRERMLVCP